MVKPDNYSGKSLEADIIKWRHVKGGTDRDGKVVSQPLQLYQAEIIDGICQRYCQLPSAVLEENASLLKLLHIVSLNEEKPN